MDYERTEVMTCAGWWTESVEEIPDEPVRKGVTECFGIRTINSKTQYQVIPKACMRGRKGYNV